MVKTHERKNSFTKDFYLKVLVLSGLQLLVVVDGTVIALAIPEIKQSLNLTSSGQNWVISSYIVFFGGFMMLGGRLGDTFGRKKVFLTGVFLFTSMSALCGIAQNEASLVVFRAFQGLGAAIAAPTAMALVTTSFPAGRMRNKAFAIYGGVSGVGSITGLILGGFLVTVDWRLIFFINIPVGILVFLGGFKKLQEVESKKAKLDIGGALLVTSASIAIIYTLQQVIYGFTFITILSLITSILLIISFIFVEKKGVENPIIPVEIFRNKSRVMALLSIFFSGALLTSLAFIVADFLQKVLNYSPLKSGLAVIPFAIGLVIAAGISSRLAVVIKTKWTVIFGSLLSAFTCFYAGKNAFPEVDYFPKLFLSFLVVGFGCGFGVIALSLSVVARVGSNEVGPLTAFANVAQDLGGIIGLMSVTQVANRYLQSKGFDINEKIAGLPVEKLNILAQSDRVAFYACGVIALVIIIPASRMKFTVSDIAESKKNKDSIDKGEK